MYAYIHACAPSHPYRDIYIFCCLTLLTAAVQKCFSRQKERKLFLVLEKRKAVKRGTHFGVYKPGDIRINY